MNFMFNVCDLAPNNKPRCPTYDEIRLCLKLIHEESLELTEAMWRLDPKNQIELDLDPANRIGIVHTDHYNDIVSRLSMVADGLADLIYVVLYTANVYGIDIAPHFVEVQRSNMSKVGGTKDKSGKLIKPDTYSPADLTTIIRRQLGAD